MQLKGCLEQITQLEIWQALQPLTTAYVIYMAAYYSHCNQQVRPVKTKEASLATVCWVDALFPSATICPDKAWSAVKGRRFSCLN